MLNIGNIEISGLPLLLAPMEDVTDAPFRILCRKFGADIVYTEFIASEALLRNIERAKEKLEITDEERPVGIQLFGNNVDSMRRAAIIAESLKPDIIDINFGCPVRKIAGKGCGAGLLNDLPKMAQITAAVVSSVKVPVTVKTRLGWDDKHKNIEQIALHLQDNGIRAITIHGRTRAQLYKGSADWTLIGAVKNNPKIHIPVIGNGDIDSADKALEFHKRYNVDAIMIGRSAVGNPWIFSQIKHFYQTSLHLPLPSIRERTEVCRVHLKETVKIKGEGRGILMMRKHYANYFRDIPDFKQYRLKLVTLNSYKEVNEVLYDIYWNLG